MKKFLGVEIRLIINCFVILMCALTGCSDSKKKSKASMRDRKHAALNPNEKPNPISPAMATSIAKTFFATDLLGQEFVTNLILIMDANLQKPLFLNGKSPNGAKFSFNDLPIAVVTAENNEKLDLIVFNQKIKGCQEVSSAALKLQRPVYECKGIPLTVFEHEAIVGHGANGFRFILGSSLSDETPVEAEIRSEQAPQDNVNELANAETISAVAAAPNAAPATENPTTTRQHVEKELNSVAMAVLKPVNTNFMVPVLHDVYHLHSLVWAQQNREDEKLPFDPVAIETYLKSQSSHSLQSLIYFYLKNITSLKSEEVNRSSEKLKDIQRAIVAIRSESSEFYNFLKWSEYDEGAADYVVFQSIIDAKIGNYLDVIQTVQKLNLEDLTFRTGGLAFLYLDNVIKKMVWKKRNSQQSIWENLIERLGGLGNLAQKNIVEEADILAQDNAEEVKKEVSLILERLAKLSGNNN